MQDIYREYIKLSNVLVSHLDIQRVSINISFRLFKKWEILYLLPSWQRHRLCTPLSMMK
ncbi:hypothetical protein CBL_00421 [Carabus blaptoides fortunei]